MPVKSNSQKRRLGVKERTQRQRPKGVDSAASGSNLRGTRSKSSATEKGKHWFHRVSYGIGFTPASREGWALVIAHIILVFVWATIFLRNHMDDEMRFIAFITIFFAQTGLLLWIAHRKGEEQ